jgi:hypothetical protein
MHRCVCVFDGTYYKITSTNYISKTSLHTTFRMYPSGPWLLKNLDVCTACDSWDNNIQLTMVKDWRPGPGMPFLEGRGLFISARVFFPVWCHPWMDDGMDGWMDKGTDGWKKSSRPRRPLLYVIDLLLLVLTSRGYNPLTYYYSLLLWWI